MSEMTPADSRVVSQREEQVWALLDDSDGSRTTGKNPAPSRMRGLRSRRRAGCKNKRRPGSGQGD